MGYRYAQSLHMMQLRLCDLVLTTFLHNYVLYTLYMCTLNLHNTDLPTHKGMFTSCGLIFQQCGPPQRDEAFFLLSPKHHHHSTWARCLLSTGLQ